MKNLEAYNLLSAKDLHQWMEEKKDFYLIHTLPSDHFDKVHLPGSANACVYEVSFIDQVTRITEDKNAVIVLYGSSARSMDALAASEKLEQNGYKDTHVLEGGIEAWRSSGFALEGDAPDAPDDPQTLLRLEDKTYSVDTDQSIIEWTGRNANTRHFGNIRISEGDIAVKDGAITGEFNIDMNSITNINLEGDELQPVLISHLQSDDFFLVKLFPTAKFSIHSSGPVRESFLTCPNYDIKGTLDLRGIKAEQNFSATVTKTSDNRLAAEAHFDIDRTRWNIIYGSTRFFEHLGMHLVFDLISIQIRIITK